MRFVKVQNLCNRYYGGYFFARQRKWFIKKRIGAIASVPRSIDEQLNHVNMNKYSYIIREQSCIFLMLKIFARAPPMRSLLNILERIVHEMKKIFNYFWRMRIANTCMNRARKIALEH